MSLLEVFALSLARSVIAASLGLGLSGYLSAVIERTRKVRYRHTVLLLTIVPLFVPELLTGFIWRPVSAQFMSLSSGLLATGWLPNWGAVRILTLGDLITEAIYTLLLVIRLTAIGCAARMMLPASPVSAAALHSWRMLQSQVSAATWRWNWVLLHIVGPWRTGIVVWCLMLLIGLQEFETAALMQLDHSPVVWSVTLFDAHAAHQPLSDSLLMIRGPLLVQALLLAPVLGLLSVSFRANELRLDDSVKSRAAAGGNRILGKWVGGIWLLVSLAIAVVWPVASQASAFADAVILMHGNSSLFVQSLGQIAVSSGFAFAAALVSLRIASCLLDLEGMMRFLWLSILPGLTGPLVSSLLVVTVFQWPLLRPLYDTWLPLLTGSVLTVLPRAVLVVILVRRLAPADSVYSAELLGRSFSDVQRSAGTRIRMRLSLMAWLAGAAAVSHWCFWDVTTVSILRPVDVEPIITRLYNEMHYGRTEILILMSVFSLLAVPACAAMLMLILLAGARASRRLAGAIRG